MEVSIVLGLTLVCVYLLATEKLRVDLVAILALVTLAVCRIVTPEEGLSGFGHPATITVACMFVLSAGLARTGVLAFASRALTRTGRRRPWVAIALLMLIAGFASGFINNTAVVAIFLPIVLETARSAKMSPSRLLMPLSFASIFGGACTLIGTSTNILVSSIAGNHGLEPFRMFELSQLGLITAAAGCIYMFVVGIHLIPDRRKSQDLTEVFDMADYLTDVVLQEGAASVGTRVGESPLAKDIDAEIIGVFRNGKYVNLPPELVTLRAGDVIRLRCDAKKIEKLQHRMGVSLVSDLRWREENNGEDELELVEGVVAPDSVLVGETLKSFHFSETFGAKVLAIRHHGQIARTKLDDTPLQSGDTLLMAVRRKRMGQLARSKAFVLVTARAVPPFRADKTLLAVLILVGVIGVSAFDLLPIAVSAVAGCALMVLGGCLKLDEVYEAVDWKVIFMLAGLLPLGMALENSGAARMLSGFLVDSVGSLGPWVLLAALYLCTSVLTEVMSNSATAVLLAPIAISSAETLGVDARPFLVAVAFAASSSFMTPVGYQTNTLIYGPGAYRFSDFIRVGTPLNLLFWLLATLLIPRFWPFHP